MKTFIAVICLFVFTNAEDYISTSADSLYFKVGINQNNYRDTITLRGRMYLITDTTDFYSILLMVLRSHENEIKKLKKEIKIINKGR
ncbi:MAG: hypothetical protein WC389_17790 [Lutibacter sp.]|jgi:hypothetical protein